MVAGSVCIVAMDCCVFQACYALQEELYRHALVLKLHLQMASSYNVYIYMGCPSCFLLYYITFSFNRCMWSCSHPTFCMICVCSVSMYITLFMPYPNPYTKLIYFISLPIHPFQL